jgi:hypothetical protein
MERLFSPWTRYRDILESEGRLELLRGPHPDRYDIEILQKLNLGVSTGEVLTAEMACSTRICTPCWETDIRLFGLHRMQLSCPQRERSFIFLLSEDDYRFQLNVDGKNMHALACSSEALSDIVDVVRRLLVTDASEVDELESIC